MSREVDFKELTQAVERNEKDSACKLMREFSNADLQDAIRALNTIDRTNKEDRIDAIKKGLPDLPKITVSNNARINEDGSAHLRLRLTVPEKFDSQRDFNLQDGSSSGVSTGRILGSCGIRDWPESLQKK